MKNKSLLLVVVSLVFSLFVINCKDEVKPEKNGKFEVFGAKISPENAINLDEAIAKLGTQDSVKIKITGKVSDVCQKKGCWMMVNTEQNECRVDFKDYGFFVDMNGKGRTAIMDGWLKKKVLTIDELKHYAKDEGQSEEEIAKIKMDVTEYNFTADGVLMQ